MRDSDIVDLYWARDERAVAETEAKYGRYCLAIARNILADGADAAMNRFNRKGKPEE